MPNDERLLIDPAAAVAAVFVPLWVVFLARTPVSVFVHGTAVAETAVAVAVDTTAAVGTEVRWAVRSLVLHAIGSRRIAAEAVAICAAAAIALGSVVCCWCVCRAARESRAPENLASRRGRALGPRVSVSDDVWGVVVRRDDGERRARALVPRASDAPDQIEARE